jgi:hypothetical protein
MTAWSNSKAVNQYEKTNQIQPAGKAVRALQAPDGVAQGLGQELG